MVIFFHFSNLNSALSSFVIGTDMANPLSRTILLPHSFLWLIKKSNTRGNCFPCDTFWHTVLRLTVSFSCTCHATEISNRSIFIYTAVERETHLNLLPHETVCHSSHRANWCLTLTRADRIYFTVEDVNKVVRLFINSFTARLSYGMRPDHS